jgi:FkbM family methyltransferase
MSTKLRYVYRAYRYRYRVDPAELRFVGAQLQSGQVAVDIGCHKGAYTYWMRRRVGPSGAVYAFEPQPSQASYLREVFSAMRYDNVALVPMAVSNACGQRTLFVPHGAGKTHAASLETKNGSAALGVNSTSQPTVDVTTLDSFFAEQPHTPDFLKIDVEGHELAVLEGASRILATHRPAILLECEARHRSDGDVQPVFELLRKHGYRGSFFLGGRCFPLAAFRPSVHQSIDSDDGQPHKRYVNNFAFIANDD